MTDRFFDVLCNAKRDEDKYGITFEEAVLKAYEKYASIRNGLESEDKKELDELLREIAEYCSSQFGRDISKVD